jgi:hypothetical protein
VRVGELLRQELGKVPSGGNWRGIVEGRNSRKDLATILLLYTLIGEHIDLERPGF